jgi:hypothetical protein
MLKSEYNRKVQPLYGKTFNEFYGKEKAKKLIEKRVNSYKSRVHLHKKTGPKGPWVLKELRKCQCSPNCTETFKCYPKRSTKFVNKEHKYRYISNLYKSNSEFYISILLKSVCQRPNKFETNALNYINTIYNNTFKYTGDGTFMVNNRSADAYSEELKTVALFNGIYWHLRRYGYEITEENKRIIETKESEPFMSAGYKVLFVLEDELNKYIKGDKND